MSKLNLVKEGKKFGKKFIHEFKIGQHKTALSFTKTEKKVMNKSLVFKRAWAEHKLKLKHNCKSNFAYSLKRYFRIANILGVNFK